LLILPLSIKELREKLEILHELRFQVLRHKEVKYIVLDLILEYQVVKRVKAQCIMIEKEKRIKRMRYTSLSDYIRIPFHLSSNGCQILSITG
jgi:hypothetical protein